MSSRVMNKAVEKQSAGDVVLVLFVFVQPLLFWRGVIDSFDLVKGTLLWIVALCLSLRVFLGAGNRLDPRSFDWHALVFVTAALIATSSSTRPMQSVFGQAQRYTGLLTVASSVVLYGWIAHRMNGRGLELVRRALIGSSLGVSAYCMLQTIGADPFEWSVTSFGQSTFGLLGNPNTSAFFLAACLPLSVGGYVCGSRQIERVFCAVAAGLTVGAISNLNSYQAWVGVVVSVGISVWLVISSNNSLLLKLIGVAQSGSLIAVPVLFGGASSYLVGVVAVSGLQVFRESLNRIDGVPDLKLARPDTDRAPKLWALGAIAGCMALSAVLAFRSIRNGLANGLIERGDFYRVALKIFRDHPLVGSGLETYGNLFTEYRPGSSASRFEFSISSSAHSIPLGFLAGGGLLLGLSYVMFMGRIGYRVVRRVFGRSEPLDPGKYFIFGSWVVVQVQSLVSVEHVVLFPLIFVTAAISLRATCSQVRQQQRRRSSNRARPWLSPILVVAGAVISWIFLSVPIRANFHYMEALKSANERGDSVQALEEIGRAVQLTSWDPTYWASKADLQSLTGDTSGAASSARTALVESNYSIILADPMIRICANGQEIESCSELWRTVREKNPGSPSVSRQAVAFFQEVVDVYEKQGRPQDADRYRQLVTEFSAK